LTYKKNIAIFLSLGMSNMKMVNHLIAQETGIDSQRLSVGKLVEEEWPLFIHAIEVMAEAHIFLDDTPALTLKQLKEKSYRLLSENKLDLIMIDNLQFIRNEDSSAKSDKKPNYIDLKILAHELNVPILAGLQLTRNAQRRNDKRPILSDLHEFDSLEDFHRLYIEEALLLLKRWNFDVVAHGPSLHDENSYYVIRRFDSLAQREEMEDTYYASDDWRQGPRERILALIENYMDIVLELEQVTVQGLRK